MTTEKKLIIELLGNVRESTVNSLLAENIDWELFVETIAENRVVPLIVQNLHSFSAQLPSEIYNDLKNRAQLCAISNLNFNAQLIKVVETLEKNKVEYLSYKGAALAQIAYGNPALRQFGDLDILIYKKDFLLVKSLILEIGGRSAWKLSDKQEKAVLKHYYEFPFKLGKSPVLLEVHWSFMESFFGFDYATEEVFQRSRNISIRGKAVRTLGNEDSLLILCVHGSKHFWKRLSWICDVGKLIEKQQIEWQVVINLARESGCWRMLLLGLQLAKDLLEIDLPNEIESRIEKDKQIKTLITEMKRRLFDDQFSVDAIRSDLHLKMRERWRDKFAYSRRLLTTKFVDSLFMPMGRPR